MEQQRQWAYGYDLSKRTGLPSGTLYPILMRLADRGLLKAEWRDATLPGRPPRHMYRLTATGLAFGRELEASDRPRSAFRRFAVGSA